MTIFLFFQDGGRPPSWIGEERNWTTHAEHLVVFITVQNLVGIDAVVLIICMIFEMPFGLRTLAGGRKRVLDRMHNDATEYRLGVYVRRRCCLLVKLL